MDSRAQQIFQTARQLPEDRRAAFLKGVCAGETALRAEVDALLQAVDRAGSPPDPPRATAPALEQAGQILGHYQLVEQIGEGGFGSVWMAEQREPVQRRVALKILKPGMDTSQVLARFEAERQALALMDHPNIAKVFDAGCTELGRPYFVMEYIPGVPIVDYCDAEKLDTRRRLGLFVLVCNAIQHAHQKGVIHRDIKPSNVLVTMHDGVPVPRVIDFGVAKAIDNELTERTLLTELRQMIGTPAYMSPEQAEMGGLDIDTRSDIYSLGVLLYELLTGTTPFTVERLLTKGLAEMVRVLREVEPEKPSTRLCTLGDDATPTALRRSEADERKLGQLLRGDLDWIVMKCLEKDRSRRYDTANALAMDVNRHLTHEPVLAGPPSAGYRLRKFVRRNRAQVVAGGVVLVALVLGIVGTTWGLLWALDEKRRADDEAHRATLAATAEQTARLDAQRNAGKAQRAEADAEARARELAQVADFQRAQLSGLDAELMGSRLRADLLHEVRSAASGSRLDPESVAARAAAVERLIAGVDFTGMAVHSLEVNVFQRALDAIASGFEDQPLVRARLDQTLADITREQGLLAMAEAPQTEAVAIRRRELGDDDPATIESIRSLATLRSDLSQFEQAEQDAREALERSRRVLGDEHRDTVSSIRVLANILGNLSKNEECDRLTEEALSIARRAYGPEDPTTVSLMGTLAARLVGRDELEEAGRLLLEVLEIQRRQLGDDDRSTQTTIGWLAVVEQRLRNFAEAERYARENLDWDRRMLGGEHRTTLLAINNLGWLLRAAERYDEAEHYLKLALEGRRRVLGEDHQHTLASLRNLAVLNLQAGHLGEAESHARQAVDGMRRVLGIDNMDTLWALDTLGQVLSADGRHAEAEAPLRESTDGYGRVFGPDHSYTLGSLRNLAAALTALGRRDDALAIYRRLIEETPTPAAGSELEWFLRTLCADVDADSCDRYWVYLEATAAAQRTCGDARTAAETQARALELLPADHADRCEYERRLGEYRRAADGSR